METADTLRPPPVGAAALKKEVSDDPPDDRGARGAGLADG